jgi:Ser/Thr protein kinase RdoA (MazF antagonist)
MKFLADGGVHVPEPVASQSGQLVETLTDPANPGGPPYLATVFVRAAGGLAEEMPVMVWEDALLEAIGREVGRLHARSCQYHPLPALDRPHWDQAGNCFNPLDDLAAAANPASPHHWVLAKRAAVLAEIERLPHAPGSYGLIHADLHFGNFYFERQAKRHKYLYKKTITQSAPASASPWTVTILDFDDCAYGWFAMDIAMNLLDAAVLRSPQNWDEFAGDFLTPYLRGYRSAHPFDPPWLKRLPLFLKLLEIGLYLMVASDYDSRDADSWVGKFMTGRRERIETNMPVVKINNL